jgi:hypothetical protein
MHIACVSKLQLSFDTIRILQDFRGMLDFSRFALHNSLPVAQHGIQCPMRIIT